MTSLPLFSPPCLILELSFSFILHYALVLMHFVSHFTSCFCITYLFYYKPLQIIFENKSVVFIRNTTRDSLEFQF